MRFRSIALTVLTAVAVASPALIPAGTAAADVPGYPTIERYHGDPVLVYGNLTSSWVTALKAEATDWGNAAGTPYLEVLSYCPAGRACVYISLVAIGNTGQRVYPAWADADGDGYDESARVRINTTYGSNSTEQRIQMCHTVGAAFLSYTRVAHQGCVSADPITGTPAAGVAADYDYWRIGFNYSYGH